MVPYRSPHLSLVRSSYIHVHMCRYVYVGGLESKYEVSGSGSASLSCSALRVSGLCLMFFGCKGLGFKG